MGKKRKKPEADPAGITAFDDAPFGRIVEGDCVAAMSAMPAGSADLIFADPPYNLQLGEGLRRPDHSLVDGVDDAWDKFDDLAAYDRFTHAWLSAARHVLADTGTLCAVEHSRDVFFDEETRTSAAMPDDFRAILEKSLLPEGYAPA